MNAAIHDTSNEFISLIMEPEYNKKHLEFLNSLGTLVADHVEAMLAYWDVNQVCRFANQAYRVWFGKTSEEMINKITLKELLGPLYEFNEPYVNGVLKGKVQFFEREIPLPTGEISYYSASYFPHIIDGDVKGFFVQVTDVSKIKKSEIELIEAQQDLKKLSEFQNVILNSNSYSIIATNPDGVIVSFNHGAEKMLGYDSEELIDKETPAIIHDLTEVQQRALTLSKELKVSVEPGFDTFVIKPRLGYGTDINEWTYIRKDGGRVPVELSVSVLKDQSGEITGYLGIAKDITDSKLAEQEIIKAKEAAEQANKLQEAFLANMSHEIRTPMNAIIGFTDLLLSSNIGENEMDFVKTIKSSGENLLRIINDILDLSKIDAGMMSFEEHAISIRQIFDSLNRMLVSKLKGKKIKLSFQSDENLPDSMLGDPTRLSQILLNLTSNAIKFTEAGSIDVRARLLEKTNDMYQVEFSVKDTGIGLSEASIEQIFERFRQADTSTTRIYGGSGLGLNIVKRLVEMQGGKINVMSQVGQGSTFTFVLPFKQVNEIIPVTANNTVFDFNLLKTARVLLAEDNQMNILLIRKLFETKSILNIDVAENGEEAVEKAVTSDYDIILMDVEMPVMNGYEAIREITNRVENAPPIIIMTAHAMAGEKEKSLRAGAVDYISKPVNAKLLFEKMMQILHPSH